MSGAISIYNTLNTNKLRTLIDSVFTISWGDGTSGTTLPMPTVYDETLPFATHTYLTDGDKEIEITISSPWEVCSLKRIITIPILDGEFPTDFGELTFTIPYSNPILYQTQTYLEDYRVLTGETDSAVIEFVGVGKSRINEFEYYGTSGTYSGVTSGYTTDVGYYLAYTIDDLEYKDYEDGVTYISGVTSGTTLEFYEDEIYQGMITRDEHLIGFLDTPQISSDIFVERGRQGVMERNLRLGEIDSTGELEIYGSGYFTIRKQ